MNNYYNTQSQTFLSGWDSISQREPWVIKKNIWHFAT